MSDPVTTDQPVAQRVTPNARNPSEINTTPSADTQQTIFGASSTSTQYLPASEQNILNKYRSWTYNFTLGALPPEAVTGEILTLEENIEKFRVFDSAGKGESGIGLGKSVELSTATRGMNVSEVVNGFNQNSAGRFDLYVDEVSIDSLIGAGTQQSGSSIASNIKFTVYEPYSMNGFIEALQVAANAAAYPNYMQAVFALRVRFIGYRDDLSLSAPPEVIPNSTRYFCITISKVDVSVSEQGTVYRCEAVPYNQLGFGTPNTLTTDVRIAGNTVHEVLTNLFKAINTSVKDAAKAARGENAKHDIYEITCPALVPNEGEQEVLRAMLYSEVPGRNFGGPNNFQNDIIRAQMNDELKEVNVFQHGDPASFANGGYVASRPAGSTEPTNATAPATTTATPNTSTPPSNANSPTAQPASEGGSTSPSAGQDPATNRLIPTQGTVVFGNGRQIHDCIAAVVRDSKYVRGDLLTRQIELTKQTGDPHVIYFTIRLEVEIIPEFDTISNRYFCIYRYVLEPYRIHYARIPGYEQGETDYTAVKKQIKREYNYIYSGKNVDILKFQLTFDTLYFTGVPSMQGNRPDRTNTPQAASHNNTVDAKINPSSAAESQSTTPNPQANPTPQVLVDPSFNVTNRVDAAGQEQQDPYYRMARSLHDRILNTTDLVRGKLEILGDPYFLVTGGMGNQNLRLADSMYQTVDGQASITQGDLVININFRTPKDINVGGPNSGFLEFDTKLLPFSGLYRIALLKSNFNDGVFTQSLDLIRCPGQVDGGQQTEEPSPLTTSPLPGAQVTDDSRPLTVLAEGIRESGLNFANIINRGLPNPGLPGALSNFSSAILSAEDALREVNKIENAAKDLLNQVPGIIGQADQLLNQIGTDPLGGLDPLKDGISLSASAFGEIASTKNLAAAAVTAAGSSIGNIANIPDAAVGLANNVADSISSLPGITKLPQDVSRLADSNVSGLVSDIGNTISKIQNAVSQDLTGISSKLGIDPSKLAGLSPNLSSKFIDQLQTIADLVPENTNITELDNLGVFFDKIGGFQIPNLPPIQPQIPAPDSLVDPALDLIINPNGNITSTLDGKTALAALTEINKVSNSIGNLTSGIEGGLGQVTAITDQLATVQGQINGVVGDALGVANQVGSINQNAISGVTPASVGLGSVESSINSVNSIAQTGQNLPNSVAVTVNVQFGSRQNENPLTKLINNSNIQGSI